MALVFVHSLVEVHDVIVQSRCRERIARLEAQSEAARVGLAPPTDVGLRASLLRTDVGEELVVGRLLNQTDGNAIFAVGIVLDGASAVVFALVEVVRHVHHHTVAEHIADLGILRGGHLLEHMDGTTFDDNVGHHELSLYARHVVCGLHRHLVLLLGLFGGERGESHLGILPGTHAALQTGTHIVIGDGAPEVRTQRATLAQQIVAQHGVLLQQTCLAVELHGEVSIGNGNLVGTLLVGNLNLRLRSLYGLLLEVAAAMAVLLHG